MGIVKRLKHMQSSLFYFTKFTFFLVIKEWGAWGSPPSHPPPPPRLLSYMAYRNRVWFLSSLVHSFLNIYNFGRVCQNYKQEQGIAGKIELICLMKFLRAPSFSKAMTLTLIFSIAIANKWLKNKTAFIFFICPKQGVIKVGVLS